MTIGVSSCATCAIWTPLVATNWSYPLMTYMSSSGMWMLALSFIWTSSPTLVEDKPLAKVSPSATLANSNWTLEVNLSAQTTCPKWFCGQTCFWRHKDTLLRKTSYTRTTSPQFFYWITVSKALPHALVQLTFIICSWPIRSKRQALCCLLPHWPGDCRLSQQATSGLHLLDI